MAEALGGPPHESENRMTLDDELHEISRSPKGPKIAAFFDFDGTLIDGYSAAALYSERFRNLEVGVPELVSTVRSMLGPTMSEDQFGDMLRTGVAGWAGRQASDIEELGERLFVQGIAGQLFHESWRLVKAHQRRGHTVVIATSATRLQVASLAREIGVDDILCTELEERDGVLTGRVAGRPPWGEGKADAVKEFAKRAGISLAKSYAYANGDEDVPFLAAVGKARVVNPQDELARVAAEHDWPTLDMRKGDSRFNPLPVVRTAAMYGALAGSSAAGIAIGVLTRRRRRGIDFATSLFAHVASALGDVDIEVIGEKNVWSQRPAVFLINHQSSLIDLLVTTSLLKGGFTAVAKRELADVPVLGQILSMAEFAFVDRSDSERARDAMAEAQQRLADGVSIVISPEGTRSLTPQVGEFKKGAFHLAWQAGVPIVPVVIRNAGELMWRNAKTTRNGTVQVVVHEPIPTADWQKADLDRTVRAVHDLYVETLENWPSNGNAVTTTARTTTPIGVDAK